MLNYSWLQININSSASAKMTPNVPSSALSLYSVLARYLLNKTTHTFIKQISENRFKKQKKNRRAYGHHDVCSSKDFQCWSICDQTSTLNLNPRQNTGSFTVNENTKQKHNGKISFGGVRNYPYLVYYFLPSTFSHSTLSLLI